MKRVGGYQPVHPASVRHIPLEQRGDHANWRRCDCPACEFVQALHAKVRARALEQTEPYGPPPRFFIVDDAPHPRADQVRLAVFGPGPGRLHAISDGGRA